MKQIKTEKDFAAYIKPFLKNSQRIETNVKSLQNRGDYHSSAQSYDCVIKEKGLITHIFEVKNGESPEQIHFKALDKISELYYSSPDGDQIDVGLYLALYNNGKWEIYNILDLHTVLNVREILKEKNPSELADNKCFNIICWVFASICAVFFFAYLIRTMAVGTSCLIELSMPIVTFGLFSAGLFILPYLLKNMKEIRYLDWTVIFKEKEKGGGSVK